MNAGYGLLVLVGVLLGLTLALLLQSTGHCL